jgi:hypothetical protein
LKVCNLTKRNIYLHKTGDLSLPFAGISEADKKLIIDNVNIFIHGAATTDFDVSFEK